MSFELNEDLYEYSVPPDVCLGCYDVGKSPQSVIVSFSGIRTGAAWAPPDPPPPNGTFEVQVSGPCLWVTDFGFWEVRYENLAGNSGVVIWDPLLSAAFSSHVIPACQLWFSNNLMNPAFKYYDGHCIITPPLPGGSFSEIDLAESVGMDLSLETWANPRPLDGLEVVHAFSRVFDRSFCHVKVDHS